MSQSCLNCPSYLASSDTPSKFKKSIGAPMCGTYGHVLGRVNATEEQRRKIGVVKAKDCPSFGKPLPPTPERYDLLVTLPDPATIGVPLPEFDKNCTSCSMCKNFIPDRVVNESLGWTAGLCAAKGKLVLPTRIALEARNCEYRQFGPVRENTLGINLLPEYEDAFSLSSDPVKLYFKNRDKAVDPREYKTDRSVSTEEQTRGIRAWRKFVDPEGTGNETFLPIYDPDFFSDEERAKIPMSGDDEHPELYVDHFGFGYLAAVTWRELDETPAAWGQAGVGKTEGYRWLAWMMCLPFERISVTAQTEIDDLAGKMLFTKSEGMHFQYGRLPRAWNKPGVVCLDEPNVADDPAVWHFIRPLTDNSKQMVLDMNAGERIARHDDCYLGLAMNPAWDSRNYGTQQIGDADANRLFHIYMELPPAELEKEIISHRVALDGWALDKKRLDLIMSVAVELRGLIKDDTLPITWGLRPQIKVARAMRWFDPIMAYRRAIADYLEPEAQETLLTVVRSHVGY